MSNPADPATSGDVPCRLCGDAAVVLVRLDRGCVCCPDVEQSLCEHHWGKCTPLGSMSLVCYLAEPLNPLPGVPVRASRREGCAKGEG